MPLPDSIGVGGFVWSSTGDLSLAIWNFRTARWDVLDWYWRPARTWNWYRYGRPWNPDWVWRDGDIYYAEFSWQTHNPAETAKIDWADFWNHRPGQGWRVVSRRDGPDYYLEPVQGYFMVSGGILIMWQGGLPFNQVSYLDSICREGGGARESLGMGGVVLSTSGLTDFYFYNFHLIFPCHRNHFRNKRYSETFHHIFHNYLK